jgi:hypothetical protein
MVQILTRTLARNFNVQLIRRELRQQFPAKFMNFDLGGYEIDPALFTTGSTMPRRIVKPRSAPHVVTRTLQGEVIMQPGELRGFFEPDLSPAQVTAFDAILANHVETDTTPRQNAEDIDASMLAEIEAFAIGPPWNAQNNPSQNQHIARLNRMILRIWKKLDPGE